MQGVDLGDRGGSGVSVAWTMSAALSTAAVASAARVAAPRAGLSEPGDAADGHRGQERAPERGAVREVADGQPHERAAEQRVDGEARGVRDAEGGARGRHVSRVERPEPRRRPQREPRRDGREQERYGSGEEAF